MRRSRTARLLLVAALISPLHLVRSEQQDSELINPTALAFDRSGNLFVADHRADAIFKFAPNGTRSTFAAGVHLSDGNNLAFDAAGNLFVFSQSGKYDVGGTIFKFTPDGSKSTFATEVGLPYSLAFDPAGNLFTSDWDTGSIFKFTPNGDKTTFATTEIGATVLASDQAGNLFAGDPGKKTIFKFEPTGASSAFATGIQATALAFDKEGNLFVGDWKSQSVLKFTPDGTKSTFAAGSPKSLAFDGKGNLFVSDSGTHSIFKFTPTGDKSTFAGVAGPVQESAGESHSSPALPVIDVAHGKAELVAGTGTSDGSLALAWTVRPLKDAAPVVWNMLEKDRAKFRETYSDDEEYFVEILVVDVASKKSLATLKLAKSWSLPGYGHESLIARWGPADKNGRRFAIVNCDRKWSPQDLILLSVTGDSVSQRGLLKSFDQTVQKFVAQKNKGRRAPPAEDYTVEYPIFGLPEIGERKGFSDPTTLWLPFEALIPKSEEAPGYAGVLHLKLAHTPEGPTVVLQGAPITNSEKHWSEDLMSISGDARLLEADRRLNDVYGALRGRLSPAAREQLKQEQLAWLNNRNAAWDVTKGEAEEKSLETPFAAANREALKITQERTAQLKQWLDKLKSNPKYNPIEAETYYDRADADAKEKRYDAAVQDIQKAIELDPTNGDYYSDLGWYQLFNGKPRESIAASLKALELSPDDAVLIKGNLAHGYLFDNQFDKAKAIYLENKDAKLYYERSFRQAVLGDFKEFEEAGVTHPDMEKIKALLPAETEVR